MRVVLIVEDDWLVLELLRTVLQMEGHEVLIAPGPMAAVGLVKARPPDVIVTDFFAGTTPDACRRSLGDLPSAARGIPILGVTGRRFDADVSPRAFGVDDIVTKPFELDEIVRRVGALLDRADGKRLA